MQQIFSEHSHYTGRSYQRLGQKFASSINGQRSGGIEPVVTERELVDPLESSFNDTGEEIRKEFLCFINILTSSSTMVLKILYLMSQISYDLQFLWPFSTRIPLTGNDIRHIKKDR